MPEPQPGDTLPAEAIEAAAWAIHFWHADLAADEPRCHCLPGHPTARYDHDRERAIRALEAAAPALRAQGAAAEREACAKLAEQHGAVVPVWHQTSIVSGRSTYEPFADLIRARTTP